MFVVAPIQCTTQSPVDAVAEVKVSVGVDRGGGEVDVAVVVVEGVTAKEERTEGYDGQYVTRTSTYLSVEVIKDSLEGDVEGGEVPEVAGAAEHAVLVAVAVVAVDGRVPVGLAAAHHLRVGSVRPPEHVVAHGGRGGGGG